MSFRIFRLIAIATLVAMTPIVFTGCVATMPVTTVTDVTIRPKDTHVYQNGMYHYLIPGTSQVYSTKKKLRKPVTVQVTEQRMVPIMPVQVVVGGPEPGYPPPQDEPPPRREGPPPRRERPAQRPRREEPRPAQRAPSAPPARQQARPPQTAPSKQPPNH